MNKYKDEDLHSFFASLPPEEIERENQLQIDQAKADYERFRTALAEGTCYLCGHPMNSYASESPCIHWLALPEGIKKKDLVKYLSSGVVSFFSIDSYVRWLASTEKLIGNISDSEQELSATSLYEATAKYKNIEWSLSVGYTDMDGHEGTHHGSNPHFHLQILVDGKMYFKFGDAHIPIPDKDLFYLEALKQAPDLFKREHVHGAGTSLLDDEETLDRLAEVLTHKPKDGRGLFRRQTIILPKDGRTISGSVIAEAQKESERTGELVGVILERKFPGECTTIITLADDPPEIKKRSGKK